MTHSATMVTKVKNFLDKLNPVPFLSKIEQEIRDNERSKLQQEVNRISLALDEYLRNHIKGYHASHNKVYKNFNFVYRSAHGLKKELQIYLNDWISANCDHLFDCFVDINVKPEYGFHIDQQLIVYLSDSPNKNKLSNIMLYRVVRFGDSSITILHTVS